jgi:hypothetical protein
MLRTKQRSTVNALPSTQVLDSFIYRLSGNATEFFTVRIQSSHTRTTFAAFCLADIHQIKVSYFLGILV